MKWRDTKCESTSNLALSKKKGGECVFWGVVLGLCGKLVTGCALSPADVFRGIGARVVYYEMR